MHQQQFSEKFVLVFKGQTSPLKMEKTGCPKSRQKSTKQVFMTSEESENMKTKGH